MSSSMEQGVSSGDNFKVKEVHQVKNSDLKKTLSLIDKQKMTRRRTYPGPRRPGWWTSPRDTDLGHDRPPHSNISLLMKEKNSIKSKSLHCLPRNLGLLNSNRHKPFVTPFVERQPCHSLNSLLWQHSPSGPIAGKTKQDVMIPKKREKAKRRGAT